jgi:hypothetical protein
MTGCRFASSFASTASARRINYYAKVGVPKSSDVPELDGATEVSARAGRFLVALFPHVRTTPELGDLLRALDESDRWGCSHVPWRAHERLDASLVRVTWRTEDGPLSSVMGFAPLGTMPVTRRAPFVGLALWPGGRVNPFRKGIVGPGVGLVDGAHGMEKESHDANWKETHGHVVSLFADPPEDRETLRDVAFCIPRSLAQGLRFKDGSKPPEVHTEMDSR